MSQTRTTDALGNYVFDGIEWPVGYAIRVVSVPIGYHLPLRTTNTWRSYNTCTQALTPAGSSAYECQSPGNLNQDCRHECNFVIDVQNTSPTPTLTPTHTPTSTPTVMPPGGSVFCDWVDDMIPPSGVQLDLGEGIPWNWIAANPPPFSGTYAHASAHRSGISGHGFIGAQPFVMPSSGGTHWYTYIYLDGERPREIMLQWQIESSDWGHRAYWGENLIPLGTDGTPSRMRMGDLPQSGGWVRLEIPLASVYLIGKSVTGMAFTRYDGKVTWDKSGIETTQPGFTCPAGSGFRPESPAGKTGISAPNMTRVDELRAPPKPLFCLFGWCFQVYRKE